jgi:hypothetical protein
MEVSAETLKLGCHGHEIGMVDLASEIPTAGALASDPPVSVLELIELGVGLASQRARALDDTTDA